MNAIVQFVVKHGYSILFAVIFAHQIGLPIPDLCFCLRPGRSQPPGSWASSPRLVWQSLPVFWLTGCGTRHVGGGVIRFCTSFTASRETPRPTIAGRKRPLPGMGLRYSCWPSLCPEWTQ
jgi:hypothetical protein